MAGVSFALPGGIGVGLGGMGLPPLQLASSASSGMEQSGASFGASFGDWNVNVGGSGAALQGATSTPLNWWLIAAAVGAAWLLLRK